MNILVFGGAGYIGSHTVLKLREQGNTVWIADDFSSGSIENYVCGNSTYEVIFCDITKEVEVAKAFEVSKPDAVILFAAKKSVAHSMSDEFIDDYTITNLIGACNVIAESHRRGVNKFIFSSSAAVYGEPSVSVVNEETPTSPINYYGETKLIIEKVLNWYCNITQMKGISLRYFNVSGYDTTGRITTLEKDPENLIPIVMEVFTKKRDLLNIFGNDYDTEDGTCIRDYIHVEDLADAHVLALQYLDNKENGFYTEFCLGTSSGTSVDEIRKISEEVIEESCNYEYVDRRPGDPSVLTASSDKASNLLKWNPKYNIKDIINSTWSIYRNKK